MSFNYIQISSIYNEMSIIYRGWCCLWLWALHSLRLSIEMTNDLFSIQVYQWEMVQKVHSGTWSKWWSIFIMLHNNANEIAVNRKRLLWKMFLRTYSLRVDDSMCCKPKLTSISALHQLTSSPNHSRMWQSMMLMAAHDRPKLARDPLSLRLYVGLSVWAVIYFDTWTTHHMKLVLCG